MLRGRPKKLGFLIPRDTLKDKRKRGLKVSRSVSEPPLSIFTKYNPIPKNPNYLYCERKEQKHKWTSKKRFYIKSVDDIGY